MASPFDLGMIVKFQPPKTDIHALFARVRDLGFTNCQLDSWSEEAWSPKYASAVRKAAAESGVEITTLWVGWPGPRRWNFTEGPLTLGLVPREYRAMRLDALKRGSDFAAQLGVPSITTHVGFIPEDLNDRLYRELVVALQYLAEHCKRNGQQFLFETGQETPVTLLRTIQDVGTGNLGINLDPANLILYGKANPVDAIEVFGQYVQGVHIKDGLYPTDGHLLGKETRVGEGKVDFPRLLKALANAGYKGTLTIEREITGDQQIADVRASAEYLTPIIEELRGQ